jgi:hypothetical protein
MSGFDGMLRSQAQTDQVRMGYDAQRYESMRGIGQAAMQAPGMVIGSMQAMQQMQLAEQQMAIVQRDADMRLALQQQEFQQNGQKLMAMAAIDEADMRREGLRAARLQNDAQEFELRRAQQQSQSQPTPWQQMSAQLWSREPFAQLMLSMDIVPTMIDGVAVGSERNPEMAKSMRERYDAARTAAQQELNYRAELRSGDAAARLEAQAQQKSAAEAQREMENLEKMIQYADERGTPEYQESVLLKLREVDPQRAEVLRAGWAAASGGGATLQPTTPAVQAQAQASPIVWHPDIPNEVRPVIMRGLQSPKLEAEMKDLGLSKETMEWLLKNPSDPSYGVLLMLLRDLGMQQ